MKTHVREMTNVSEGNIEIELSWCKGKVLLEPGQKLSNCDIDNFDAISDKIRSVICVSEVVTQQTTYQPLNG